MRRLIPLCIIVLPAVLFGQIVLDEVMSPAEQKKTGVATLTYAQKAALEAWLNKNFVLKQKQQVQPVHLSLSINIEDGRQIQLSDGSTWDVDPQDYHISKTWLMPIPIEIKPSGNRKYPDYLIDKNTQTKIRARKMHTMHTSR